MLPRPISHPANTAPWLVCVALLSVSIVGCGSEDPSSEMYVPELPPVVEKPPAEPVPADTGLPGQWEATTALEPAGRLFVVSSGTDAPPTAGLVLVPGRWGVQKEFRDFARQLATNRMVVVVPDLYDGVVPRMAVSVSELQAGIDEERALDLIQAALERARQEQMLESPAPLFVIGTGAGAPLAFRQAVRSATPVQGVVLDAPGTVPPPSSQSPRRELPVLVVYGAADVSFDANKLDALQSALEAYGASPRMAAISGAGTELFDERAMGFSNDAMKRALEETLAFFDQHRAR